MATSSYNFYNLLRYVTDAFSFQLKEDDLNISYSQDKDKEKKKKQALRESMKNSHAGDPNDRALIKQKIERLISVEQDFTLNDFPPDYRLTPDNIDEVINWNDIDNVNVYLKFLALMLYYEPTYKENTFAYLIEKYELTKLRTDSNGETGFFISSQDIHAMFDSESIEIDYDLKLKVIVQVLYEEFKGNSAIDTLIYQKIDDISVGVSGLPDNINPTKQNLPYAYEGCWIKYHGMLIHLRFLTLKDFETLKKVVKQTVSYDQVGQFSEDTGFYSGYGKDGSRRTSAISPFGECSATWIRKFTAIDKTNEELVCANNKIKNADKLLCVEKALVQGGATIPICGPQGVGKTTKLQAIAAYIQNFYAIRMIESEFEARLRLRYPTKNIYTVQTNLIDPTDAYNFSLRSSGDIYIISEARTDDMVVNITRTANRGGRSVLFTFHPNNPHNTPIEVANALIREGLYNSLKDAMYTVLNSIKCCIYLDIDYENDCRYYNIYEFQPCTIDIPTDFLNMTGQERSEAFMKSQLYYYQKMVNEDFFRTVPIITFDRESMSYQFNNNISDRFYDELYRNSAMLQEKREIEQLFRPEKTLARIVQQHELDISKLSKEDLLSLAKEQPLNMDFLPEDTIVKKTTLAYQQLFKR